MQHNTYSTPDGIVLYKVNPSKLAIEFFVPDPPKNNGKEIKIKELPSLIDGIFYCITEVEAQLFIKRQIGM